MDLGLAAQAADQVCWRLVAPGDVLNTRSVPRCTGFLVPGYWRGWANRPDDNPTAALFVRVLLPSLLRRAQSSLICHATRRPGRQGVARPFRGLSHRGPGGRAEQGAPSTEEATRRASPRRMRRLTTEKSERILGESLVGLRAPNMEELHHVMARWLFSQAAVKMIRHEHRGYVLIKLTWKKGEEL